MLMYLLWFFTYLTETLALAPMFVLAVKLSSLSQVDVPFLLEKEFLLF